MPEPYEDYPQESDNVRYYYPNQQTGDSDTASFGRIIGIFFAAITAIAAMYSIKTNVDQNIINVETSVNERVKVVHESLLMEIKHLKEMRTEDLERDTIGEDISSKNLKLMIDGVKDSIKLNESSSKQKHEKKDSALNQVQKITAEMKIEFQRVQAQFTGMKEKIGVEIKQLQEQTARLTDNENQHASMDERIKHIEKKTTP